MKKSRGKVWRSSKSNKKEVLKKKPNWNQFRAIQFPPLQLKSIEKNSNQALCKCGTIYKIVHCVTHQNITMSCSLQYEYISWDFKIIISVITKNLNLICKKLGLNHSFASTALSVEAQIQMFLKIALRFWCLQSIEGKTYDQFLQPPM
jgi:hypothetical protein